MDVSVGIYNSESGIYRKHERVNLYNEPELTKISNTGTLPTIPKSEALFLLSISAIISIIYPTFLPP